MGITTDLINSVLPAKEIILPCQPSHFDLILSTLKMDFRRFSFEYGHPKICKRSFVFLHTQKGSDGVASMSSSLAYVDLTLGIVHDLTRNLTIVLHELHNISEISFLSFAKYHHIISI